MEKKEEVGKNKKNIIIIISILVLIAIMVVVGIFIMNKKDYKLEEVTNFSYFRIFENNQYGVIDTNGTVVIEPNYDMLYIPNPSKAVFVCYTEYKEEEINQKTTILNEKKEAILTQYEQILPLLFKEKITEVPFEKSVLKYKENGKYGIINFEGKKITKAIYDSIESLLYKEGCLMVKQEEKAGIINMEGKEMIPIKYDTITADEYYNETTKYKMAGFILGNKTQEGYRYGYANEKGEVYLEPQYNSLNRITEIEEEKNVYMMASKNGQVGVYKNKELIVKHSYEEIEYNATNELFLVQKTSKEGVIDKNGKEILPVEYDTITFSGKNMNTVKKEETKIYNSKGEEQKNSEYSSILATENENYFITINKEEKFGVMNKNNEVIIKNNYQYIEYAFGDYFIVTNEGKVGVVNKEGKLEIGFIYNTIQKLKGTNVLQAIDSNSNITELYDISMNKVYSMQNATIYIKESYIRVTSKESIKYFNLEGKFMSSKEIFVGNELFASFENGKCGFVNKEDKLVVQRTYDMVTEFNSYGFAGIQKEGKWGVIDQKGNILVEPKYDMIDWQNPEFIGKYAKLNLGYGFEYYTDELVKE